MSALDDRYTGHPIHKALEAALSAEVSASKAEDLDQELIDYFSFANHALSSFERLLSGVDPELVPISLLSEAEPHLNELKARFDQFVQSNDRSQVTGVTGPVDGLNRVSSTLAGISAIGLSEAGLQEAVTSYRRSAGQHLANLGNQMGTMESKVESLGTKVGELAESVASQKARVDSVISEYQSQFSTAQESRTSEWGDELKRFSDAKGEALDSAATDTAAAIASIEKEAEEALKELSERRDEARRLIEATAVDAVARDYKTAAAADGKIADRWRKTALVAMGLGIVALIALSVFLAPSTGIEWTHVARAFLVAGAFAAPALYAQRESNSHRAAARRNQRFALELDALEPYLANFGDPEGAIALKTAFAAKVFGGEEEPRTEVPSELTNSALVEVVKLLAKQL